MVLSTVARRPLGASHCACMASLALLCAPVGGFVTAPGLNGRQARAYMRRSIPPPLLTTTSNPEGGPVAESAAPPAVPAVCTRTGRPRIVLGALLLLYVVNQWARMLPSFLVSFDPARMASAGASRELMNVELGFDQAQYGLLVSYGFSLTYTLMALPAGALCDQYPRKLLLLASATGWSAALAASAVAATYGQLLASRVMLGIAQALATPAAVTLIADLFPPSRRATATSVYSSGIYLGGALASLSVVMSRSIGWRATASVVAASSALPMLLIAALLREPPRTTSPPPARPASKPSSAGTAPVGGKSELGGASLSERLQTVLGVKSVRFLLAATAARFFGGFAIGAWTAPFYRMHFPSHATLFSLLNALVVAGGGSLSAICGGVIADKLVRANRSAADVRSPV